jgi:hypothetical protein
MTDDKLTVLTDEETMPSRPGIKFYAFALMVMIGGAYLLWG